ncbi:hypothetical protein LO763_01635 [Glycomyces sp. A-F 0318]|uniref:hypothetical protein n=1 Tax=Glycomyces amatae TaxID=2881355 RepID=UPI001E43F300|nr:hypothetical protein [Glycomyces amatae]MCD0442327.1 hypothetical protein [Glycomyces amatae]
MTTYEHEAPLRLLQDNPKLAEELYCGLLGRRLPDYTGVETGSEAMTREHEAVVRNCDNVTVFYRDGEAVFALLFEVQRSEDKRKHYSWLDYIASARSRLKCPVALVVITFDEVTAKWAGEPIDTGHPSLILYPLVIGPCQIPAITDPREGRENLAVSLLSLIAHCRGARGPAVMRSYYESIRHLDQEDWTRYAELALNALGEEDLIMSLQEMIVNDGNLPKSYRVGLFGERYDRGRADGKAEGEAIMLLRILESRGVVINEAARGRILECGDSEQLERWADHALSIEHIEELFV